MEVLLLDFLLIVDSHQRVDEQRLQLFLSFELVRDFLDNLLEAVEVEKALLLAAFINLFEALPVVDRELLKGDHTMLIVEGKPGTVKFRWEKFSHQTPA